MHRVFSLHGLASDRGEAAIFHHSVAKHLDARVTCGYWNSQGAVLADLIQVVRRQINIADDTRDDFRRWLADSKFGDAVVAHSYGTVVARQLVAEVATEFRARGCRVVLLGSPMWHPLISMALPQPTPIEGVLCEHLANTKDPICSWFGRPKRYPGWLEYEFADEGPEANHHPSIYLRAMQRFLAE